MKYCKDNKNFVILIKNLFDSRGLNILNPLYFFSVLKQLIRLRGTEIIFKTRKNRASVHNRAERPAPLRDWANFTPCDARTCAAQFRARVRGARTSSFLAVVIRGPSRSHSHPGCSPAVHRATIRPIGLRAN